MPANKFFMQILQQIREAADGLMPRIAQRGKFLFCVAVIYGDTVTACGIAGGQGGQIIVKECDI